MDTRVFSVYNLARGALLNSALKVAESAHQPLKLLDQLISGLGLGSQSGLWLLPVTSPPLIPRVFPYDFIYLDPDYRVLHTAEIGPGVDFPPYPPSAASALILPSGNILASKTAPGDRLLICPAEELEAQIAASESANAAPISAIPASPESPAVPRSTRKRSAAAISESSSDQTISLPVLGNSAPSARQSAGCGSIALNVASAVRTTTRTSNTTPFEQAIEKALAAEPSQSSTLQLEPAPPGIEESAAPPDRTNHATAPIESAVSAAQSAAKPPISITEVVLNQPRPVQAPIIEHHTDPEDLFSNWVVSPSAAPGWVIENGFNPPVSSKAVTGPQLSERGPASGGAATHGPAKAESKSQPAQAASLPEAQTPVDSGGASSAAPSPRPAPASPSRQKSSTSAPARQKLPAASTGSAQISASTTFSATPYSMWRVSTPTAVAPASPARSSPAAEIGSPNRSKSPADSGIASLKSGPAQPERTTARTGENSGRPSTAQFVRSIQERIERLQENSAPNIVPTQAVTPAEPIRPAAQAPPQSPPPTPAHASKRPTPDSGAINSTPAKVAAPAAHAEIPLPLTSAPNPQFRAAHAEVTVKPEPPRSTLKSRFQKWLKPTSAPSDRRRAARRYVPGMVAHYFTGGAPKPHAIADISMTGFYLLTEDRWMPGTMIQMTLQKPTSKGDRKQSITVLSRVVRRGSDGVATEFVMPGTLDPYSHEVPSSQATDRFALARFL